MRIAYQNHHMLNSPSGWLVGDLQPAPGRPGYEVIYTSASIQLSIQPGGIYGSRDTSHGEGNGVWEQFKRSGNVLGIEVDGKAYGIVWMAL